MKCLMFGLACDQYQFDSYILKNANPFSVAHYLFETKFIENFQKHFTISHNYIFQSNNHSFGEAFVRPKKVNITTETETTYLSFINLPVIKFFSLFKSTYQTIKQYNKKNKNDFFVLSTVNYLPVALATTLLSHKYKYKNIIIFTDCSVGNAYENHGDLSIKKYVKKAYQKIVHYIENKYDAYILFSKAMNEVVNCYGKPYCVMEGFFNASGLDFKPAVKYEKFVILYAGSLIENLGIQNIIGAFEKSNNEMMEFWIVGEGPYKEKLIERGKGDVRIKFFGYISHTNLFNMEKKASILINARDPQMAYTKYSFPSKTFEYLVSETPFLSTKLACYPKEYDQFIWFIKDNSAEAILAGINKIAATDQAKLLNMGKKARVFVETQKSPEVQVEKIAKFVKFCLKTEEERSVPV